MLHGFISSSGLITVISGIYKHPCQCSDDESFYWSYTNQGLGQGWAGLQLGLECH